MRTLKREELKRLMDRNEDIVIINVLAQDKFNEKHIPGSVNIPGNDPQFTQRVELVAGTKDRHIVVYCGSEPCDASPKAGKKLEQAGFKNVYDYEGGIQDWQDGGLPVGSRASKVMV